jgi:hypothetical protein
MIGELLSENMPPRSPNIFPRNVVLQGVFITLVALVLGELESIAEDPLVAGVARASMDRQNSLAVEWRGWLGLGKRQGWSEGRRGGEWRNDGVNVGS